MTAATSPSSQLTLAQLIDLTSRDGQRDELFVRSFTQWLSQNSARLSIDVVDALGLVDVAATFKMKGAVTLLITGHRPNLAGEVTVRITEAEFPSVVLTIDQDGVPDPYEFCTLDYSVQGRRVLLAAPLPIGGRVLSAGHGGEIVVATTIGEAAHYRICLEGISQPVNLSPEQVIVQE